jgi:hypothetical protein
MGWIDRAQYVYSQTPFSEYKKLLIRGFAGVFFTHYIFKFIILFNAAATNTIMYNTLDSINFTSDHWVMYLAMSLCYAAEATFFALRILAMDLIAGLDILIGALAAFDCTLEFSKGITKYFCKITLLQFILVLITAFGIAIIDESPVWLQIFEYQALIIILLVISFILVFGFGKVFRTAKYSAKFFIRSAVL